jgi:hypothetical protein
VDIHKEAAMKRMLILVGMLFALGTGVAQAQTRVGVTLSFGDPYFGGHVVIGRPYYHRYSRPYYYRYHPAPVIVVAPRVYRAPRVVVVRPHRVHARRSHHRRW